MFNAANICLSFSSPPMVIPKLNDILLGFATSMRIYKFSGYSGERYVERITRPLSQRVNDHHSSCLVKGTDTTFFSSVPSHLVSACHVVDRNRSYKVISRISTSFFPSLLIHTRSYGVSS